MIDEAKLIAWIDGELPAEEAEAVAKAVAQDDRLAELADRHRALSARLRDGFSVFLSEPAPPPPDILAPPAPTPSRTAPLIELSAFARKKGERQARLHAVRVSGPPAWAGLAAGLVAGLAVGRIFAPPSPGPIEAGAGGALAARGVLAHALESELAGGHIATTSPVRVALTFRAQDGRLCRSWTMSGQAGVACRGGSGWAVVATAAVDRQNGAYQQAAGPPPALMAAIQDMIAGEPFDAAQEARAKAAGWR